MTVAEIVRQYEAQLGRDSPSSVRSFHAVGLALAEAFGDRDHLDVAPTEIKALLSRVGATWSKRTQYMWLCWARAAWYFPERWLGAPMEPRNPFRANGLKHSIARPRRKARAYVPPQKIDLLIGAARTTRARLLLRVLQQSAIRVSELVGIEARDVQDAVAGAEDGRRLVLRRPKSGQEEEAVALPRALGLALRAYIRTQRLSPGDRVFPVTTEAVRALVRSCGRRVGLTLTPHDLRRAWASAKDRAGVPIGLIQATLRHESQETTKSYIAPAGFAELLEIMEGETSEQQGEEEGGNQE